MNQLTSDLSQNIAYIKQALGVDKSFDVIHRELEYGGKKFALFFVDGFAKDDIMNLITVNLSRLQEDELTTDTVHKLLHKFIGYLEVDPATDVEQIIASVLSGPAVLLMENSDTALIIDARTYPARGPAEPDTERVVRGARDGYTETLVFNTALTRRRLRDPNLRMEYMQVGRRSKTDVVISYIEDIADPKLIDKVRKRLQSIDVDGVPMADKTIEEFVFKHNWNPFPLIRYTERPDVAAIHLLEGHILIFTDTSPSVIIAPTTLFHHVQHAEEYRQKPVVGAYLRWIRFTAMLASVFLLPIWFMLILDPWLLPSNWQQFEFIFPKDTGVIPIIIQLILVEIGIDVIRMASIHTPTSLASTLGLVAALMIGDLAIHVGLLSSNVILYFAIAAIGTFATPSYEFGLATRLVRLSLLLLTAWLHIWGFIIGSIAWFIVLLMSRSIGTPYLWPLIPFNGRALLDVLVRNPVPAKDKRPAFLHPQDPTRE
ncbi:spore germination protein [Paenibacillus albiflavus]|uniref:Spore germination protein n=1 Tax=Paenibacillus albiflavus TaxID=2545760 RepID=A0A4R4EBR8_9BACL|nr:spore germination protein [Paenibacillus albiflavus]TCZ76390.1 spore germination protein [Paenibacillus albiflavus]